MKIAKTVMLMHALKEISAKNDLKKAESKHKNSYKPPIQ